MADQKPHTFSTAPNLYTETQLYTQRLNNGSTPAEYKLTIDQLYLFLQSNYGIGGATINPTNENYNPSATGNPARNYNQIITALDGSTWFIDTTGKGLLLTPVIVFEILGAVNSEKVVTAVLPDPANFSITEMNQMLELYSGGVRLFFNSDYTIDINANKIIFPFDQGGEIAHLLYTKLYY